MHNKVHIAGRGLVVRQLRILVSQFRVLRTGTLYEIRPDNMYQPLAPSLKKLHMENLLYYPYINIPRTDWTARTLLYYDKIGSIVPQNYFYEPEKFDPFMREMVSNELVIPINPIETLDRPWEISRPFIEYVNSKEFNIKKRRKSFSKGRFGRINENKFKIQGPKIHVDKFDSEIFYQLEEAGLAKRLDYEWYMVEQKTAKELMNFLASVVANKIDFLPATDTKFERPPFSDRSKKVIKTERKEQIKR